MLTNTNIISCNIKDFTNIRTRYLDTYELARRVLNALTYESFNMAKLTFVTGISDYKLKHYLIIFLTNELITYTHNEDTSDHGHRTSRIFHITDKGKDTLVKLNQLYSMIGYNDTPTFANRINNRYNK